MTLQLETHIRPSAFAKWQRAMDFKYTLCFYIYSPILSNV